MPSNGWSNLKPGPVRRSSTLPRVRFGRRAARWLILANLSTGLLLGGWYLLQPESRQTEVSRVFANALRVDKQVSFLDLAWDIWQLYYAGDAGGRVAQGDRTIIYGGVPRVAGEAGDRVRVLLNRAYAVGYSDSFGNPLWAAYRVHDMVRIPEPGRRPGQFETDRRTAARIPPDAYSNSGYDRGHLAPNYAIATRHGPVAQRETFLMSNVTPQKHALNAGPWRELELRIATSYPARYGEVWVLTGPVFESNPRRLRAGVAVPESFFSIVIDEVEGRLRTIALIIPQEAPADASLERYLTTIAEIQRRTGLDFLSELADDHEKAVEEQKARRVW